MTMPLSPETVVHRVGGATVGNLRLKPAELGLTPPGLSLLVGGTPADAAAQMRAAFPRSRKWRPPVAVGSATVGDVRAAGFDVAPDPTAHFPNHARLVHPLGAAGFTDDAIGRLATAFRTTAGC